MDSGSGLSAEESGLCSRHHYPAAPDALIYLPGLHGDWTLLGPFRESLHGRIQLLEFTYPRTLQWDLNDYAGAVLAELQRRGIKSGWILGESFSSQVAWAIFRRLSESGEAGFTPCGLILVGGFVKHPIPWGVRLVHAASGRVPLWFLHRLCAAYARWAQRRCRLENAAAREINLFVDRRSREDDRAAITGRYQLIQEDDLRPVARALRAPVFVLSGAKDLIVPWPAVLRWLRRNCPGFREERIVWTAGHNVLLDAPTESAEQIMAWIRSESTGTGSGSK